MTFEMYCDLIKKWQNDGYPLVTDDVIRQKIADYDEKLCRQAEYADEDALKLAEQIEELYETPVNYPSFDLGGYLSGLLEQYQVEQDTIKQFEQSIKDAEVLFMAPRWRLANFALSGEAVDDKYCSGIRKSVNDIVADFCQAPYKINQMLGKSLKEHPLIIRFDMGRLNAAMDICIIEGNIRPVLWIRVPDFNEVSKNKEELAGILAHELGHWLDFSHRPLECLVESDLMQECFADIVGGMVLKNAGYQMQPFIKRVSFFMTGFDKPELVKYRVLSEKRTHLLKNCFGTKLEALSV